MHCFNGAEIMFVVKIMLNCDISIWEGNNYKRTM